jgi:hypothetical protein
MQSHEELSVLAQTIQLALAPVFLLSGIAAFLNVLNSRLLRVVDRTRALEVVENEPENEVARLQELSVLMRRRQLMNRAVTLCTLCALLIAGIVALMFVGTMVSFQVAGIVAYTFIIAMIALIGGLLSFLWEVQLAVRYFRRTVYLSDRFSRVDTRPGNPT